MNFANFVAEQALYFEPKKGAIETPFFKY